VGGPARSCGALAALHQWRAGSEVTALRRDQGYGNASTFVPLLGKGRQERPLPLWADTAQVLRAWFRELGERAVHTAVPRARGTPLARAGVDSLLPPTVQRAVGACPSRATKKISPPVLRPTTARPLLQAGVDSATIALWLGHERIATPPVSLHAALAMKEKALATLHPIEGAGKRCPADDPRLAFLASL